MPASKKHDSPVKGDPDNLLKGKIFAMDRYAIHDGPGVRSLVFMKGCQLRCVWCSNPEGQNFNSEIAFFPAKCIGCGACVEICPQKAVTLVGGKAVTDWKACDQCGNCAESCFPGARKLFGKTMTVEELLREVKKDIIFFNNSGGGVTIGGGEVTAQPEFVTAFLKNCKNEGLQTAIETCGHCNWKILQGIANYTDLIYYDIKHMDPKKHKELTGVSNKKILENLIKLSKKEVDVIIRIPIIPGLNDDESNILETVRFIKNNLRLNRIKRVELLPYHKLGAFKYDRLGRKYRIQLIEAPGDKEMDALKAIVEEQKFLCQIGG